MDNALELNIYGIKCDNEKCDFKDMSVNMKDYEKWLNKACPKCGANLLTQEDFDNTSMLVSMLNYLNKILPPPKENEEIVTANIKMNGTGSMDFKINK